MVVENAGNGNVRVGMALGQLIVKLETRIESLESSIHEMKRRLDERH